MLPPRAPVAAPMLLALALALPLVAPIGPAAAAGHDPIQPGDVVTSGADQCTLNFVFDGVGPLAGRVFIGTAAHCFSGQTGQLVSSTNNPDFGRVFYTGDYSDSVNGGAAVENGIPEMQLDFALVEVLPQNVARVSAAVRGHATTPTGATSSAHTVTGDIIHASGYGAAVSATSVTRENRAGTLFSDTRDTWRGHLPVVFGDSGGPVVHASGKALGVVSGNIVMTVYPFTYWHGPTVEGVLAEMQAIGKPVALRTI